ncbi:DUF1778 domain-containing protein [Duganella sp. FT80W]|uniref:DUF1778 domain-containing protein n=1 Tax=Duganella guangzhouensis TaxID=2666084 RepID=A0A6I2L984_9BURK|nr:DUF1778 domain-containing protein [Duganella guangzhouensis]MRW94598.1 DUF1778 domain-containing protein [Duganella guangzhouensis]
MPKSRTSIVESSESLATTASGEALASTAKASVNLRLDHETRYLIEEAAAILGKSRADFMVDSARRQALDVLLDQRLFILDKEQHQTFAQALNNAPPPGPKLKSLLRRVPAWNR